MSARVPARRPRRRPGRGALTLLAALLVGSGAMRLADGIGGAFAAGGTGPGAGAESPLASAQDAAGTGPATELATSDPDLSDTGALADLLAALREREARVAERERAIEARAQQLDLAERTISENLAALAAAEDSLKATLALADGAMENDIERLTRVYETMKPKEAAALFETMDPTFAAGFLARMSPEAAAGIMAGLAPEMAYSISILLAGRHREVPRQ